MSRVGFGIFHVDPYRKESYYYDSLQFEYINTYIFDAWTEEGKYDNALKALSRTNKTTWITVTSLLFDIKNDVSMIDVTDENEEQNTFNPVATLKENWQANLDALVHRVQENGCWECFNGIYLDEPLLWNVSLEQLKETTGYFRNKYPDKGVFICFSVAGVAPDVWTTNNIQPITPDAGQYITDVAYDMYHKFDSTYEYIANQMKARMGNREDLKIWYIPCTMDYRGDKEEQHCLDHLQGCYELLKKEQNPGGLFCFTYYTFPAELEGLGNVGLEDLTNPHYKKYWKTLQTEIERIGREICSGQFHG